MFGGTRAGGRRPVAGSGPSGAQLAAVLVRRRLSSAGLLSRVPAVQLTRSKLSALAGKLRLLEQRILSESAERETDIRTRIVSSVLREERVVSAAKAVDRAIDNVAGPLGFGLNPAAAGGEGYMNHNFYFYEDDTGNFEKRSLSAI